MTSGWLLARNDLRALAPIWAGSVFVVFGAGSLLGGAWWTEIAFLIYILGSLAIGAHAFGHEYTHRTLATLLTQPAARSRIFITKLGVAAPLIAALAVVAYAVLVRDGGPDFAAAHLVRVIGLIATGSLFVAPLMTLRSGSSIAGVLFATFPPGAVVVGAAWVGMFRFGVGADAAIETFQEAVFWRVVPLIVAAAVPLSWREFRRLQALERYGTPIDLRSWIARSRTAQAAPARRSPAAQLFFKELHLQQLSFVVASIHAGIVGAAMVFVRLNPTASHDVLFPLSLAYAVGQTILIGALASAEERQLGTLEWQLLVPISAWRQWAVKTGVVVLLTLVLSIGVPAFFLGVLEGHRFRAGDSLIAAVLLLLAAASLHVSSLTKDGVRALIWSVPVAFGGWLIAVWLGRAAVRVLTATLGGERATRAPDGAAVLAAGIAAALVAALLVRLGHANHRTVDSSPARAARQGLLLAALVVAAVTLVAFVGTRRW